MSFVVGFLSSNKNVKIVCIVSEYSGRRDVSGRGSEDSGRGRFE